MANVFDVAQYILEQQGLITAMKLQKLVYYSQAWSLVWDEKALFTEEIQAWANGPVTPALYNEHRGIYNLTSISKGDSSALDTYEKETIDVVLGAYGDKSSQWLSDRTHSEMPWIEARKQAGISDGEICNEPITQAMMMEYYSSL